MRPGLKRYALPLGGMIVPIANEAVFPMLPLFQRIYGINLATANAIVPSMMLPLALMMLVSGAINARLGRRRMLVLGFGGISLGSLVIMAAPDFVYVLAGRILQGAAAAFVMPGIIAAIGDEVEPALRGKTMGVFMLSITVGAAIGPAIGGWLSEWGGVPPVAAFIAAVAFFYAVYYWVILGDGRGEPSRQAPRIGPELRRAYRSRAVIGIGVTGASIFIALIGSMTFSATTLGGEPFGFGPGVVGSVLAVGLGAGIFGAIAGGALTDSSGRSSTTVIGLFVMCAGAAALIASAVWPTVLGLSGFVIGLSALALGHAIAMTALETLSVEVLPTHRDAATSLFNALRFSGYAVGPPLAVWLFGVLGHAAWVYACLTAVLCAGGLYFLGRVKPTLDNSGRAVRPATVTVHADVQRIRKS